MQLRRQGGLARLGPGEERATSMHKVVAQDSCIHNGADVTIRSLSATSVPLGDSICAAAEMAFVSGITSATPIPNRKGGTRLLFLSKVGHNVY